MLSIVLGILLIPQCFVHGLDSHENDLRSLTNTKSVIYSETPNGYIENSNNNDWSIPDSKFYFNYEQMRKDQPTQVEQREEDLDKYMYKNPTTSSTTTTPAPVPNVHNRLDNNKFSGIQAVFNAPIAVLGSPYNQRQPHQSHHHHSKHPTATAIPIPNLPEKQEPARNESPYLPAHSWDTPNYQPAYPAKMPPPPALPKWEDLNELIKHHSRNQQFTNPQNITSHKEYVPATTEIPMKVTHRPKNMKSKKHERPTAQSVLSEITPAPSLKRDKNNHHHINRGSHKFSWEDVSQAPTVLPSSTTLQSISSKKGNPPPPVPTLSPWYDGFGK